MDAVTAQQPWYVEAFDRTYLRLYSHRNAEEAERRAPDILRLVGLRAGHRVLDIACGEGRYARAFQTRGLRVTGVDLSKDLLEEARERARLLPGSPLYVHGDMRRLPFHAQFDGAVSLFTSIGYFETEADDAKVFAGAARALVPGGRFLVDFFNAERVRNELVPEETRHEPGHRVEIERRIDESAPGGPRVNKRVRVFEDLTQMLVKDYEESVRLYGADDLTRLMSGAGLGIVHGPLGDVDGRAFDADAPRLVLVGARKAR